LEPALEKEEPGAMDQRGGDGGRDRPERELQGLDGDAAGPGEADDQQHGADGDENILADEGGDVVDSGRVGADGLAGRRVVRAFPGGGRLRHGCEYWTDGRGLAGDGQQADRRGDLAEDEIAEKERCEPQGSEPTNQGAGAF